MNEIHVAPGVSIEVIEDADVPPGTAYFVSADAAVAVQNLYLGQDYRLFVNEQRTVLVWLWDSGAVHVATREDSSHVWGPPIVLKEES